MARPLYESKQDLENEKKIVEKLKSEWNIVAVKLPIEAKIDYHITEPTTKNEGWLEIKKRNLYHNTFDTFIISYDKWKTGQALAKNNNSKFYIMVWYKDGVYWTNETNTKRVVKTGGRTDRGDSKDIEDVVHIPTSEMQKIFSL